MRKRSAGLKKCQRVQSKIANTVNLPAVSAKSLPCLAKCSKILQAIAYNSGLNAREREREKRREEKRREEKRREEKRERQREREREKREEREEKREKRERERERERLRLRQSKTDRLIKKKKRVAGYRERDTDRCKEKRSPYLLQ